MHPRLPSVIGFSCRPPGLHGGTINTSESVIPAQAGIQRITDFVGSNILDPGFRRGDEAFFNELLIMPMH
jgi:hypothetical protein